MSIEVNPVKQIRPKRIVRARYQAPTNNLNARVTLKDMYFKTSKTIDFGNDHGTTREVAIVYLEGIGFNVIGYTSNEIDKDLYLICDWYSTKKPEWTILLINGKEKLWTIIKSIAQMFG